MSNYKHIWFQSHDGLKLYARDYPTDKPLGTIICIPGLTRNSADFSLLCEHLSQQYRVIAVDLRGRGQSAYDPNPNNYFPGIYAEDIMTLLDELQLSSVVLIGTSLGGLVSMLVAAQRPNRVSAVIMNDIGPEANQSGLDRIKSYVCNTTPVANWEEAINKTQQVQSREYPDFERVDWERFTRNIYNENSQGTPELNYDPAIALLLEQAQDNAVPPDLWPVFEAIRSTPLLVFRGELSDILSVDCVEKMLTIHQQMDYKEVSRRGHTPLLSESESLDSIDNFLERIA